MYNEFGSLIKMYVAGFIIGRALIILSILQLYEITFHVLRGGYWEKMLLTHVQSLFVVTPLPIYLIIITLLEHI